ncbi:MAG: nuclear transport factor 2 family protein [Acidobacteria bacterium]|nr:nuclear transport factor 2 family protein [Acidobacteriota bacterium]MBV9435258.1 nuclear transport factor 2 family protein [Acidobacteriota bacterium]
MKSIAPAIRALPALVICGVLVFAQQNQAPLGDDPAQFDARVEAATVRHDANFFSTVLAEDVRFTHGTGLVQNKQQWVDSIRKGAGQTVVRELDSTQVEPHGDLVETLGHVHVEVKGAKDIAREYHIWFVRLYQKRQGGWQLVSNRTVRQVNGALPTS